MKEPLPEHIEFQPFAVPGESVPVHIQRFVCILVAATLISGLSGCSSQRVRIRSNDPDADLYVDEACIGKGSGVAVFRKKKGYLVTARKEGCTASSVPASATFDAVTLWGLLIGLGVMRMPTVVVDPRCRAPSAFQPDGTPVVSP